MSEWCNDRRPLVPGGWGPTCALRPDHPLPHESADYLWDDVAWWWRGGAKPAERVVAVQWDALSGDGGAFAYVLEVDVALEAAADRITDEEMFNDPPPPDRRRRRRWRWRWRRRA